MQIVPFLINFVQGILMFQKLAVDFTFIQTTTVQMDELVSLGVDEVGRAPLNALLALFWFDIIANMVLNWAASGYYESDCCSRMSGLFYCLTPAYQSLIGESEYKLNCQQFRQHTPLWLRPPQSISQNVSFTFKQCAIVVIQAITLSSLAGMARDAQDLGANSRSPEDYVGTSAILFAISLAQSAVGVIMFVRATYNELTGSFLRATDEIVDKVKAEQPKGWNDKGTVEVLLDRVMGWFCMPPSKRYESRGRLMLGTAGSLVPLLGGFAASGALIMSVAIGSAYHSVVRSVDISVVLTDDTAQVNDDALTAGRSLEVSGAEAEGEGGSLWGEGTQWVLEGAHEGGAWVCEGVSTAMSPVHAAIDWPAAAWSHGLMQGVRLTGLDGVFLQALNLGDETGSKQGGGRNLQQDDADDGDVTAGPIDAESADMLVFIMSIRLVAILFSLAWVPLVVLSVIARGATDCSCGESQEIDLPHMPPIPDDDDPYVRVTGHPRNEQEFARFCALKGISKGGKDIRGSLHVHDEAAPSGEPAVKNPISGGASAPAVVVHVQAANRGEGGKGEKPATQTVAGFGDASAPAPAPSPAPAPAASRPASPTDGPIPDAPVASGARGKAVANPAAGMLNEGGSVSGRVVYLIGFGSLLLYFYVCVGLGGASVAGVAAFTLFWSRSYFLEIDAVLKFGCLGECGERLARMTLPTVQPPWGGGEDDLKDAFEEHLRTVLWLQRSAAVSAGIDAVLCIWAFSYTGIREGLETRLFEGFEVSIACGYIGLVLCCAAVIIAVVIEVIGSLRFSDDDEPSVLALRAFVPVIYTPDYAAVLSGDAEEMELFGDDKMEYFKLYNQLGGVTVPLDPWDIMAISSTGKPAEEASG